MLLQVLNYAAKTPRPLLCLGVAIVLEVCGAGCAPPTPPSSGTNSARQEAALNGDQAQVEQLVLINRMLASREMAVLGAYGHASVRSAANPERYFMSRAVSPALVTTEDIYESDLDSAPVTAGTSILFDDRFLHGEIYKARPDVMAIVFSKTPALVAFSVSSVPLPTNSLRPDSAPVPVFDIRRAPGGEQGAVNTPAIGGAMAAALGKHSTMLVFGNGAVIVAGSAGSVVNAALDARTGADNRAFDIAVGGTPNHMIYTRRQAIPEAGGSDDTGPSGRVERINRFAALFNHLGGRDLTRVARTTAPPPADPNSDQALIDDLVLANRLMASDEIGALTPDGLAHVSVRSRTNPNHYFIAHDVSPGMVTAADVLENDLDSVPAREADRALPQYSERYIHGEIYKARPDIMAILHAHTPELVSFGQSAVKLRPVLNTALFIGDGLPLYDLTKFTGGAPSPVSCAHCISTPQLGRALAGMMREKDAALLLDHGIALGAPSLRALVSRAYNLRLNARIQVQAIGLGGAVSGFEKTVGDHAEASAYPEWDYWKQRVLGSVPALDPAVAYKPPSGLPTSRR